MERLKFIFDRVTCIEWGEWLLTMLSDCGRFVFNIKKAIDRFEHGIGPFIVLGIILFADIRWCYIYKEVFHPIVGHPWLSWLWIKMGLLGVPFALWCLAGVIAFCCGMSSKEGEKRMRTGPPSLFWTFVLFTLGGPLLLCLTAFHKIDDE